MMGKLVFAINGQRFELSAVDPSTTLLEFLRYQTAFKSPKLSCGEGGCGACVVLLSKYDPANDKIQDFSVSSCLTLLCSVNGCAITTSEGIGNSTAGFHRVHQRLSQFHATQCGFCSPGMCMSLFAALVDASKTKKPSSSSFERSIVGNLCRCTGYRSIADACKSFAADFDIEDLGFLRGAIPKFPHFFREAPPSSLCIGNGKASFRSPRSLSEISSLMEINQQLKVKLVAGNTGAGYRNEDCSRSFDMYVDLRFIPELSEIEEDEDGIRIGASVTIARIIEALRKDETIFRKLSSHMEKIANTFVRNTATIGGNLVMAQRTHFPSDIAILLLALDSSVTVFRRGEKQTMRIEEFFDKAPLDFNTVLLSIKITRPKRDTHVIFNTYRASPRPLGNCLAHLTAAFMAEVLSKAADNVVLGNCRFAIGAYATQRAKRAREVEEIINGKVLTIDVLLEAINILEKSFVSQGNSSEASDLYGSSLGVGFLFEFLSPLINATSCSISPFSKLTLNENSLDEPQSPDLLLPSKRIVQINKEHYPVGEPLQKSGAALQASGEAVFVDDIPSPVNCLFGAFIYSTKPLARVKSIGFGSSSLPEGVSTIISFKDIPRNGENVGSKTIFGFGTLFADDLTRYAGERLALVVADSQRKADEAARIAVVEFDEEGLEPAILTVEDAVKRSSFFDVPPLFSPKGVGDVRHGFDEADHRSSSEISLGSQYHFYMENQAALAIPDEDNSIVVYSSSQSPEYTHAVIAKCLGVPEHNVRVITRRVGGGFGGKAFPSMPVATSCALAGQILRRPVRMYLERKTDMIMAGGRHPMKIRYTVGFKSTGKITALSVEILINAGIFPDVSPVLPHNIANSLKKYNWGSLSFLFKVCKTNTVSRTAMRAPGELQGSFIADSVIQHVASFLSLDPDEVKTTNLHNYSTLSKFYQTFPGEPAEYTLKSMWDKVASSSCFAQRRDKINQFNSNNIWNKRGISRVPVIHEVMVRPTPARVSILSDGSIVVEVGGIELGQGLWTKVKQMAAFALTPVNCDSHLLDKIRVIQSDTLGMIQGGFTSGSTTSESSCEAVRLCCEALVMRLGPLKNRLQAQLDLLSWQSLVSTAHMEALNMSATTYYVPHLSSMGYLNYGTAVSEVEINLLTGEMTMLRSDIVYDCGQSLNPAVDLGQIEGAFVQGIGFFVQEEYKSNAQGLVTSDSTWSYKIPTVDTVPKELNVEIHNSGHHRNRVLSSKASGEPPLLLAGSVHAAANDAVRAAHRQLKSWEFADYVSTLPPELPVPATMSAVKQCCGLQLVQKYLHHLLP